MLGGAFRERYSGIDSSCCISDLQPGRSYRCRVSAASAGGVGQVATGITMCW